MNDIDNLKTAANALLRERELPSQKDILEIIDRLRMSFTRVTDPQAADLALEFEAVHGVRMNDGTTLKTPEFKPWLDNTRSEIDFFYWERYREFIRNKVSGQVLGGFGNVTDKILGLLENPTKDGEWDRRGMVMGHVQSGKTANYIGVVTKAADAGYRVIIIIAGLQNNLRNQTQKRVDEGFIGFSSKSLHCKPIVGVGNYNLSCNRKPNAFTTTIRDFHKKIAENLNVPLQNLNEPAVFVIKKNSSTLRNLIEWLRTHNAQLGTDKINEPMLLIDDEADNASINIKKRMGEISRINGQIRELLGLFKRSNYVGYTATPFANIFIDPDSEDLMVGHDLFPRDFIVSLDPPTNYFGPTHVFRDFSDTILQNIDDHEQLLPTTHKINHIVKDLPKSLKEAIRVFILARAIRLLRGQKNSHNSMLVNVSRFVDVQKQVFNHIQNFIEHVSMHAKINGSLPVNEALKDHEIAELHSVYKNHYENTYDWSKVQQLLHESISAITIVEINSRASGSLDYSEHKNTCLNVIAVGGFSLSRGLTLEGLTVSYFLRRSMMYDSLFQMGRWFGYRTGYEDLCRVWMPEEAQGWYSHIADSIEELHHELVLMQSSNSTPIDFGLRVRSHPDSLMVTARNKMGSGENKKILIGLANQFVETAILSPKKEVILANLNTTVHLANAMRVEGLPPENGKRDLFGHIIRDVPVNLVIEFLRSFKNHPGSLLTESGPVLDYIRRRAENELKQWDVLFACLKNENKHSLVYDGLGFHLVCQRRTSGRKSDKNTLLVTNKQRVSSRGITKSGLSDKEIEIAEREYYKNNIQLKSHNTIINYPDWIYTKIRTKPLLVIHLLSIGKKDEDLSHKTPVTAWSISFPSTKLSEDKVEYIVNSTWVKEHIGDDTDEAEDIEDDEY